LLSFFDNPEYSREFQRLKALETLKSDEFFCQFIGYDALRQMAPNGRAMPSGVAQALAGLVDLRNHLPV